MGESAQVAGELAGLASVVGVLAGVVALLVVLVCLLAVRLRATEGRIVGRLADEAEARVAWEIEHDESATSRYTQTDRHLRAVVRATRAKRWMPPPPPPPGPPTVH